MDIVYQTKSNEKYMPFLQLFYIVFHVNVKVLQLSMTSFFVDAP